MHLPGVLAQGDLDVLFTLGGVGLFDGGGGQGVELVVFVFAVVEVAHAAPRSHSTGVRVTFMSVVAP